MENEKPSHFLCSIFFYFSITGTSQDIILKAELEKEVVSIDESLILNIQIINSTDSTINILKPLVLNHTLEIVLKQGGREIKWPYLIRSQRGSTSLNPNETYETYVDISRMFSKEINSGDYQLSILYHADDKKILSLDNLSFEVLTPTAQQLEEKKFWHSILNIHENEEIVINGKAFIEKYPNSKYLARVVMSTSNSLRQLEQYDEALKYLEMVFESSNKIENNDKTVILHKMADLYFHNLNQKKKAFEILDSLEGELAERKKGIWNFTK